MKNQTENQFNFQGILNISEVGLPTNNIEELGNVIENLGMKRFRDSDNFKVLGDDDGLLILVSHDRVWFMGEKLPSISPVSLKIKGEKNKIMYLKLSHT